MRYGIKVRCGGQRGSFLIHDEDGLVKSFEDKRDALDYAPHTAVVQTMRWPWEIVEVFGARDE